MVTISARVDESLKGIAKDIGVSLSTAITVFLKRFVAARGFPFDVIAPNVTPTLDQLHGIVSSAVADSNPNPRPAHFTYDKQSEH